MEGILKDCGIEHAIDKFKEHRLEIANLTKLTSKEIKELLPRIGDRHLLKDEIELRRAQEKNERERHNSIDRMSGHTSSRGNGSVKSLKRNDGTKKIDRMSGQTSSRGSVKRLNRNDVEKKNTIVKTLRTNEARRAVLTEMAENMFDSFSPPIAIEKYRRSGFTLIDLDEGKISCPICLSKYAIHTRKTRKFKWQIDNLKRHLLSDHAPKKATGLQTVELEADDNSLDDFDYVNSVLEVIITEEHITEQDITEPEISEEDIEPVSPEIEIPETESGCSSIFVEKNGIESSYKTNKYQSFMHHKSGLNIALIYPTPKQLSIEKRNCFLTRNVRKYLQKKATAMQLNVDRNIDIIRCICGLFNDKQTIQCTKCRVWQHTECTGADINGDSYLCERCDNRMVDLEIPLNEYSDEGYRYYLTLMRGDLQVRITDTVYVLRDIPISPDPDSTSTSPAKKHTYKTIGNIEYTECDIFRVERLWKDNDGNRFVFGYNYVRPAETYHKAAQKYFHNEVIREPVYEVMPIDLIMRRCWVVDRATFCEGRPVACEEPHIYICELRVNKAKRMLPKLYKEEYPVCKKSYAFKKFSQKLKISRNYSPHNSASLPNSMPIQSKVCPLKNDRLERYVRKLSGQRN